MLEYEKKIMLTANEYHTLAMSNRCKNIPKQLQTNYYFDTDNLPDIKNGIEEILKNLGEYKQKIDEFFSKKSAYTDEELQKYLGVDEVKERYLLSEYADLHLGEKILKCVEENGSCEFEAEL